jgi:hypothetical protein
MPVSLLLQCDIAIATALVSMAYWVRIGCGKEERTRLEVKGPSWQATTSSLSYLAPRPCAAIFSRPPPWDHRGMEVPTSTASMRRCCAKATSQSLCPMPRRAVARSCSIIPATATARTSPRRALWSLPHLLSSMYQESLLRMRVREYRPRIGCGTAANRSFLRLRRTYSLR